MTSEKIRLNDLSCLNKWFAIKNPIKNIINSIGLNG